MQKEGKKEKNPDRMKSWMIYTVLFIMIAAAGYGPFLLRHKSLIWKTDGIGQYYPAFLYTGKYLRAWVRGLFSGTLRLPLYDLSIGFGEDIIGSLNYYGFGDPMNLLAVFANARTGAYIFTAMFFLRGWLSGLAFCLYTREVGLEGQYSVPAALSYAFCGFAVLGAARYSQWYSILILLPLLLLGCEKSFHRKKMAWLVLVLSACYGALCSVYFLYNCAIVLCVYCPVRCFSIYGRNSFPAVLRECLKCLFFCTMGILLAGPVFFPAVAAFFDSENADYSALSVLLNPQNYKWRPFPELWKSLVNPVYTSLKKDFVSGINLLETAGVLLLLFRKERARRDRLLLGAIVIEFIALHLPISGYLFNAFNEFNYRWIFLFHFTLALSFADSLQYFHKRYFPAQKQLAGLKITAWAAALITAANTGAVIWLTNSPEYRNWSGFFVDFETAYNEYIDTPINHSEIIQKDENLFRISSPLFTKINSRPSNTAMLGGYNSLQYWLSLSNTRVQSLVDYAYGTAMVGRARGVNNNAELETLLGVRYYVASKKRRGTYFKKKETVVFNEKKWKVYRNRRYKGMAYLRSKEQADKAWEDYLAGGSLDDYFHSVFELQQASDARGEIKISCMEDRFRCEVSCIDDSELILAVPYSSNWTVYIDGEKAGIQCKDIMFQAVEVPEGEHTVTFLYVSWPFRAGCLSMIGAFLLMLLLSSCVNCAETAWITKMKKGAVRKKKSLF